MSVASDAPAALPITLLPNALSAQAFGEFTQEFGRSTYTVSATAGETMIVNIIPMTPMLAMAGTVKFPGGGGTGEPGSIVMKQVLTESGTYTIETVQDQMASNLNQGNYVVEVVLLPASLVSFNG